MRIRFLDIGGIKTRFLQSGEGPALFLLHGVGISGDIYLRNMAALGRQFSVYAPDMLGHGFTDAVDLKGGPPQPPTVAHLGALADALGIEKYSVAGSSYGALIAALMWFDRPTRVENLVLIGSGSVFHGAEEQQKTLRAAAANATQAMGDPTLDSCRKRLAAISYDPATVPEEMLPVQLTSYAQADRFPAYKATIAGLIDSAPSSEHRVYTRLEKLVARTLIICGREDVRADWKMHTEGRRRMPNARLSIFEKCGHLPMTEHPQMFNDLVGAFLTGRDVGE